MNKYLTEFIGTFFLVLTIGLAVARAEQMAPLAIGLGLMVLVYMGGHVSGAHYNPAATLGIWMRGKIGASDASRYVFAQVVGGLLGAVVSAWLLGGATFAPALGVDATVLSALIAEVLFSFLLVLVILHVATADSTSGNSYYGLAIGLTVTAGAYSVGSISGAAFNPAVGIGAIVIDVLMGSGGMGSLWIYIVGPLLGGALASVVFKMQGS